MELYAIAFTSMICVSILLALLLVYRTLRDIIHVAIDRLSKEKYDELVTQPYDINRLLERVMCLERSQDHKQSRELLDKLEHAEESLIGARETFTLKANMIGDLLKRIEALEDSLVSIRQQANKK